MAGAAQLLPEESRTKELQKLRENPTLAVAMAAIAPGGTTDSELHLGVSAGKLRPVPHKEAQEVLPQPERGEF